MACVDDELTELLQNESVPSHLKSSALKYVFGLTATDSGVEYLLRHQEYLRTLFTFAANEGDVHLCELAHKCFINVSSTVSGTSALLAQKENFTECFINGLDNRCSPCIGFKCQVLSNVTRFHEACVQIACFLQLSPETLRKLMFHFVSNETDVREKYDYLALLFGNLTSCVEGKMLFLSEDSPYLKYILPYTAYAESEIRRIGAAILLKNVCFEIAHLNFLLETVEVLPSLLLPLIGPEDLDEDEMEKLPLELQYLGEDKRRETNAHVRLMLLEALLKICSTKYGRMYLREKGVYFILRELHKWETVSSVVAVCEDVVEILIRDESDVGVDNLSEMSIPEHLAKQFQNLTVSTSELPHIVM